MKKLNRVIGKLGAAYLIGLFLTAWFYIPARALEELINVKKIASLGWQDCLGYLFAFSMSAVIGLYLVENMESKKGDIEKNT